MEAAGFDCIGAVEIDRHACATLRQNRPDWNVVEADLRSLDARSFCNTVDLFAGGVPCPPFSIAGKQLGSDDERDLFPEALRLITEIQPRAVLLENVPGFASERFRDYRANLLAQLRRLGYFADWRILHASDFGVPQLRPRFILVALNSADSQCFRWPQTTKCRTTVGETLVGLMGANGWMGAAEWKKRAASIAPTIVGGSKKHGGPDLGPTRARKQWATLGVQGIGIADEAPTRDFPADGFPKLTVRMVARIQGFPDEWQFTGGKTASYRQVGNALPPPVAHAVGLAILNAFSGVHEHSQAGEQHVLFDKPVEASIL